jgi:hypothetical protein
MRSRVACAEAIAAKTVAMWSAVTSGARAWPTDAYR